MSPDPCESSEMLLDRFSYRYRHIVEGMITIDGLPSRAVISDHPRRASSTLAVLDVLPLEVLYMILTVCRGTDGTMKSAISRDPLCELSQAWHETRVDILSLERGELKKSCVDEVVYQGRPAIAKYARFEYENYRLDRECLAYWHLTENGRVMGLLLEKLEGTFASSKDLRGCQKALRILHAEPIRLIHGDVNRYNFVVDARDANVRMVDFEHAEDFDETKAQSELAELPHQLVDESGRGTMVDIVER